MDFIRTDRVISRIVWALLVIVMGACTVGGADDDDDSGLLPVGSMAPDFVLPAGDEAESFVLSSLRGRWVLLEFWASWCPDCQEATPALKAIHDKYAPKGLVCVGVSSDGDADAWQAYVRDNGMDWIQLRDKAGLGEGSVARRYRVAWIPTLYLLSPDGTVVFATTDVGEMEEKLKEKGQQ